MNFNLHHKPVELDPARLVQAKKGRIIKKLNSYFHISPFRATYPYWSDASYIIARIPVSIGRNFAIRQPIARPSNKFVACIKWNEGSVVRRFQLWSGVGEKMAWPMYVGEVVPDSCTAIEIWCVEDYQIAEITSYWDLPIVELSIPYDVKQLVGTQIDLTDICFTHTLPPPDSLDKYWYRCSCSYGELS